MSTGLVCLLTLFVSNFDWIWWFLFYKPSENFDKVVIYVSSNLYFLIAFLNLVIHECASI